MTENQAAAYVYPYTRAEPCSGSGSQVPVGAMQDLNYGRCPHCGRSVYVHAKGSLHKHSRPRTSA